MKRKILSLALVLCMSLSCFAACSKEGDKAEETEAAFEAFEYTDFYGNKVTIDKEPQKVVSVSPALTEIIFELGAGDKLVGRTDYCDYPDDALKVESVGEIISPDIEKIASLEPDIVLASSMFSEESYNALKDLGITVVVIRDEVTLDGMLSVISDTGLLIGEKKAGEELAAKMKEELDKLGTGEVADDAPSVYYVTGFGEYGEYTPGEGTFIDDIIKAGGAKNAGAAAVNWSFSLEALIEADPDYILIPAWGYDQFISTEPYSSLSAVKNGNVIIVDPNIFERQGPRNLEAVQVIRDIVDSADAQDLAA